MQTLSRQDSNITRGTREMKHWKRLRYWLCLLFEIHTLGPSRMGTMTAWMPDKCILDVPYRDCIYCGEVCEVGEEARGK